MTRILPRTSFHSSKLIRCLADLGIVEALDSGNAFAEQLGGWIHFADAITLSAVHGDGAPITIPAGSLPALPGTGHAGLATALQRLQASLTQSIAKSFSSKPGNAHVKLPDIEIATAADQPAYLPYRRFYEAHQRDMELRIQPLRSDVREALAIRSPALKKLADLDATLDKILRPREGKLLARIPLLLKPHFDQLFKEHQQNRIGNEQVDEPAGWMRPGGWLARFCDDMQALLLAELDFRLQPTMGLIEAYKQNTQ